MPDPPISVPENRPLSEEERELVRFVLTEGDDRARSFISQIEHAWVRARCGCGCASVDFSIDGVKPDPHDGLEQLGDDFGWLGPAGGICSVFVFALDDLLAGFDVWSVDGVETPVELPPIESLLKSWPGGG
ncbi:MAG: hypothetical protein ABI779_22735 [Acidobacteriota bacterium]